MRRLTTPWRIVPGNDDIGDSEPDPYRWLDERLREANGRPTALFIHKPPAINSLDEHLHVNKSIAPNARARLRTLAESGAIKLIASGHLHEHVLLFSAGALLVSAPALGPVPAGTADWNLGLRCNGLVECRFSGDTVRVRLLREGELGIRVAT